METPVMITDFEQLYQSIYPATTVLGGTAGVPSAPVSTIESPVSSTEILLGIACVVVVAYGCYYIYRLHEEERSKRSCGFQ